MIDHFLGRPSTKLKRLQVLSVIFFWLWYAAKGNKNGPNRITRSLNKTLKRYTPWQIVVLSSVSIYAIRHLDSILGFGAPEPLARMYSRSFYRTTWIVTALDTGFATAINIRPLWLRNILSVLFSAYYMVYANEADEKLRKYRAFCTVEMMRTTWHKTSNPYIRAISWFHRASLPIARQLLIPRPQMGAYNPRPIKAWIFYAKDQRHLRDEEELILDYCGGGFISMTPEHHEERLRQLAKQTQKPVLAIDYCKAPEYPYPFAIEECFDVYRSLCESFGKIIGMSGSPNFRIILSGDSAGGNIACGVVFKVLEYPQTKIQAAYAKLSAQDGGTSIKRPPPLAKPIGVLLSYPALNFAFTSWMKPEHLRLLRQQSEVNLDNLTRQASSNSLQLVRSSSRLRRSAINLAHPIQQDKKNRQSSSSRTRSNGTDKPKKDRSYHSLAEQAQLHLDERARLAEAESNSDDGVADPDSEYESLGAESPTVPYWEKSSLPWKEVEEQVKADDKAAREEVIAKAKYEKEQQALQAAAEADDMQKNELKRKPFNTRLTVTSMASYFQDRILTQSMLRAMAILYIGPRRQPDFEHDYYLSPVVAPSHLLAEFPPVLFICGEKDPLCDDTVVMAGKIREAKLAKKAEIDQRRANHSARFGEQLRTTPINAPGIANHAVEDESPEDWVQMRIIEGWSHGFLQMSSLMPEAKQVISFLATWMSLTFEDFNDKLEEEEKSGKAKPGSISVPVHGSLTGTSCHPPAKPTATAGGSSAKSQPKTPAKADILNVAVASTTAATDRVARENDVDDEEEDGPIMMKSSRRSPNRAASPMLVDNTAATVTNQKKPNVGSGHEDTTIVLPSPIQALRKEYQVRSRPASFSDGDGFKASASLLTSEELVSDTTTIERADSENNLLVTPTAARSKRPSKSGATHLDEKYKSLLVAESKLLHRRRGDVLFGLENNSSVVQSEEDEDLDDSIAKSSRPVKSSPNGSQHHHPLSSIFPSE